MMAKAYWWFWFGSWNIEEQAGQHPRSTHTIRNLKVADGNLTDNRASFTPRCTL